MPIYEYQCQSCGARCEELQGINDPHLTECRECGGELKRLISSPAFQFKGSGWYVTDYAKSGAEKGSANSKSTDSSAATDSKAGDGSKASGSSDKATSGSSGGSGGSSKAGDSSAKAS